MAKEFNFNEEVKGICLGRSGYDFDRAIKEYIDERIKKLIKEKKDANLD